MTIAQAFAMELQHEAANTRKMLARVPMDKASWTPHAKSMTLSALASHVAEIFTWFRITIHQNELDFATMDYKPFVPNSTEELLAFFDKNLADALESLNAVEDAKMFENWTMRQGDQIFFTLPKAAVVRTWCFSHMIHHRGQLSVYLRQLDVPVPGMYGPTADEQ